MSKPLQTSELIMLHTAFPMRRYNLKEKEAVLTGIYTEFCDEQKTITRNKTDKTKHLAGVVSYAVKARRQSSPRMSVMSVLR